MQKTTNKKISLHGSTENTSLVIIIPVFNEEEILSKLFVRLEQVAKSLNKRDVTVSLIFVNDGSKDNSRRILDKQIRVWQKTKKLFYKVVAIHFTKNFGHQAALSAGYDYIIQNMPVKESQYIVTIDADLQDPPELIGQMLGKAVRHKLDIVYAKRRIRNEQASKVLTADLFYKVLRTLTSVDIPFEVADFRLTTRKMVELAVKVSHPHFWRGVFATLTNKTGFVEYDRKIREAGTTGYSIIKMLKLAISAIVSFGDKLAIFSWYAIGIGGVLSTIVLIATLQDPISDASINWEVVTGIFFDLLLTGFLAILIGYKTVESTRLLPEYVIDEIVG